MLNPEDENPALTADASGTQTRHGYWTCSREQRKHSMFTVRKTRADERRGRDRAVSRLQYHDPVASQFPSSKKLFEVSLAA
jgi:hypothetical protein